MFIDTHMHEMTCSKDSFSETGCRWCEIARAERTWTQSASQTMTSMGLKEYAAEYAGRNRIFRSLYGN